MEHLVKFQTAEGREGQHTAASLDAALRFVERLRNNENATDVHVFRMHEIPIEFKTYFKVELRPGSDMKMDDLNPDGEVEGRADGLDAKRPPMVAGPSAPAGEPETDATGRRLFSRS